MLRRSSRDRESQRGKSRATIRSARASGTSSHDPYAVSSTQRSPAQIASIRRRCTSSGTGTQPGSQVRSSTACHGMPVAAEMRSARNVFPEPVTP